VRHLNRPLEIKIGDTVDRGSYMHYETQGSVEGVSSWLCLTDRTLTVVFASSVASAWLGSHQAEGFRLSVLVPELADAVLRSKKSDFPIRCIIGLLDETRRSIPLVIHRLDGPIQGFLCCEDSRLTGAQSDFGGFDEVRFFVEDRSKVLDSWAMLGSLVPRCVHDLNNVFTGMLGHIAYLKAILPTNSVVFDSLTAIELGARKAGLMTRALDMVGQHRDDPIAEIDDAGIALRQILTLLKGIAPPSVSVVSQIPTLPFNGHLLGAVIERVILPFAIQCMHAVPRPSQLGVVIDELPPTAHMVGEALDHTSLPRYLQIVISASPLQAERTEYHNTVISPVASTDSESNYLADAICEAMPSLVPFFLLCSKAIKEVGGTFSVDGAVDAGITGRITLPFTPSGGIAGSYYEVTNQPSRPNVDRSPEVLPRGTEHILVMDDEESIRDVVVRSLQQLGYQVVSVASGHAAIAAFQSNEKGFDLVLLDMILPDVSGCEVFARIREIKPDAPVLVMSGYSPAGRVQGLLAAGRSSFIQKPFTISELAFRVRACLDLR
jgi:CheY-like chemotaxis protein